MNEIVKIDDSAKANNMHGRLLEAVHNSGYSFERACTELEWLLDEDRWKSVGTGYEDINKFLATINFSEFKIAIDQRKKIAKKLKELEATQRAAAKMLGVTHTTIQRDIEDGTNVPKEETKPPETQDKNKEDGTNVPKSPLDQSPTDVWNLPICWAMAKTEDIIWMIDNNYYIIRHTGKKQIGQADFYVISWDEMKEFDKNIYVWKNEKIMRVNSG